MTLSFFMLIMSSLNSIFLLMSTSPTLMILIVIIQSLIFCCLLKIMFLTSWFSMLMFLIFIGGLMILFSYITSLSPNNFNFSGKNYFMILAGFLLFSILVFFFSNPIMFLPMTSYVMFKYSVISFVFKTYSFHLMILISSLFFYLLLTLLITVFITLKNKGPLRSMIKSSL